MHTHRHNIAQRIGSLSLSGCVLLFLASCGQVEGNPALPSPAAETRINSLDSDGDQIPDAVEEAIQSDPKDKNSPSDDEKADYGLLDAPLNAEFWDCVWDRFKDYGFVTSLIPYVGGATFTQMAVACSDGD